MRIKEKKQILQLIILSCLLFNIVSWGISIPNSISSTPPASGDWIINDVSTVSGQTLVMNGSIVVGETGELTIADSTIIFAGNTGTVGNGDWNITVESGGSLSISNSELTTDDPSYHTFIDFNGSSLTVSDAIFNYFDYFYAIQIHGGDVSIENSLFNIRSHGSSVIYGSHTNGIDINNITINMDASIDTYGIWLQDCNETSITDNVITVTGDGLGIGIDNSHDAEIMNNQVNITGPYGAIYIKNHCSNVLVEDNTVNAPSSGSIPIWIRPQNINVPENLIINRNTIDMNISGSYAAIYLSDISAITGIPNSIEITNNKIINSSIGINIQKSAGLAIENNTIRSEGNCIWVRNQTDTDLTITGNTLSSDQSSAIYILGMDDMSKSEIPIVSKNVVLSSKIYGIYINKIPYLSIFENLVTSTKSSAIYIYKCKNTNVYQNTISSVNMLSVGAYGINLYYSPNSIIRSNSISRVGGDGIYTNGCNHTLIELNRVEQCNDDGIAFGFSKAINVTVSSNIIEDIQDWALFLYNGIECIAENNKIKNAAHGVYISSSAIDGEISNNLFESISISGIYFNSLNTGFSIFQNVFWKNELAIEMAGDDNSIFNNTFIDNFQAITMAAASNDNTVYFNDFIDNLIQARDYGTNNEWYYEITGDDFGNFWSDYTGIDANNDGIGDTPYNINDASTTIQDMAPLMKAGSTKGPSLTHPADQIMINGTENGIVVWTGTTIAPEEYVIVLNGSVMVTESSWDGDTIIYTIPSNLDIGNYTLICTITDSLGRTTSDEVLLSIIPNSAVNLDPSSTDGSGAFAGDIDTTSALIGVVGTVAVIGVLFILLKILRRGKS